MTGYPGGNGGDRPSLLLVDDDESLCDALARALSDRGFDVRTALSAEAAIALASASPPEYAVVDLKLPDASGLKLVSSLIALDPHTRIVVLTGYGSIATAVEAIKLGATYYLTKPADADQIVAAFSREAGDDQTPVNHKPMSVNRLEWEHIDRVLQEHKGNISETARALSMHRRTLQRKLAKRPVRH
jgi:two-component system response regulator RegA